MRLWKLLMFASGALIVVGCGAGLSSEEAGLAVPTSIADESAVSSTSEAATTTSSLLAIEPTTDSPSFRLSTMTSAESGRIVDGEFVSDEPEGAFRWTSHFESDMTTGHRYFLRQGQAEAGDYGCYEVLAVSGDVFSRNTFDSEPDEGSNVFVQMESTDAAEASQWLEEATFPTTAEALFNAIGVATPPAQLDRSYQADLEPSQVDMLVETLWGSWSSNEPAPGSVVALTDESGRITHVTLDASATSESGRMRSVLIEAVIDRLVEPMTLASPRPDVGFCRSRALASIGQWGLTTVIGGGTGVAADQVLPQGARAFIAVEVDGSVTGSTGCRDFNGTVEFGYQRLLAPSFEFSETVCDATGDELSAPMMLALEAGPEVGLRDGILWLVSDQTDVGFLFASLE